MSVSVASRRCDDLARAIARRPVLGGALVGMLSVLVTPSKAWGRSQKVACSKPADYDELTRCRKKVQDGARTYNGCGSYGVHVPSPGFTYCCNLHDLCYDTCGVSQAYCDGALYECARGRCDSYLADGDVDVEGYALCVAAAKAFYQVVQTIGVKAYEDAQVARCKCCDCTRTCPDGQILTDSCECVCPSGQVACGGACVDLQSDNDNCGECGRSCNGGNCVRGQCVCPPSMTASGGSCQCGGCESPYVECGRYESGGLEFIVNCQPGCSYCLVDPRNNHPFCKDACP